jgi:Immunoglobulin I-set domain
MVYQQFLAAAKLSVVISIASVLLACGGGSSDDGEGNGTAQTAQFDSGISLSGRAVKGVIKSGIVNAYVIEGSSGRYVPSESVAVAPVRTDINGYYRLVVPSRFSGSQFVIEVTADETTQMTCEVADGCGDSSSVAFGDSFGLASDFVLSSVSKPLTATGDNVAHVTPYTHMVRVKAQAANEGMTVANVSESVAGVEAMLGFADQAVYSDPIDLTSDQELSEATLDQLELALVSAAIQKAEAGLQFDNVADVLDSITQQLTQHESLVLVDNGLEPAVALDDLMYDAQQELASLASVGVVIGEDDVVVLDTGFSSAQQQALEEGALITPVQILGQPSSVALESGASFELSVGAIGGGAIAFQWYKDGQIIVGETNSSIAVANASVVNAGQYSVRVSNEVGSVMSAVATVAVAAPQVALHDIALSWDIPLEREDGSSLPLYEINGYTIAYGVDSNELNSTVRIVGGQQTVHTLTNLETGTYFFAIATVDSDGIQGRYSDAVQVLVN